MKRTKVQEAADTVTVQARKLAGDVSWWRGITPGGLFVVVTLAFATAALTMTACVLYLRGEQDTAERCASQAAAAMLTLVATQARLRPDPVATVEQPATVTTTTHTEES